MGAIAIFSCLQSRNPPYILKTWIFLILIKTRAPSVRLVASPFSDERIDFLPIFCAGCGEVGIGAIRKADCGPWVRRLSMLSRAELRCSRCVETGG
jgi:hypothetical protein